MVNVKLLSDALPGRSGTKNASDVTAQSLENTSSRMSVSPVEFMRDGTGRNVFVRVGIIR